MSNPSEVLQDSTEILIVEDSLTQAEKLRYLLQQAGYNVLHAEDGLQALTLLSTHKPALVISDIVMPNLDGYQLCQKIRENEAICNTPVILLTSLSRIEDITDGLSCGADSFITKPYNSEYLLKHVKRSLTTSVPTSDNSTKFNFVITQNDKPRQVATNPQRMLSLLLSTYEAAIHRNRELIQTQTELNTVNDHLEDLVDQRTEALTLEIAERERLQVELQKLSLSDELTGLHNRRGFMMLAEHHLRFALREKQEFMIVFADMNNLKRINDTFGHAQGDRCLQEVARIMKLTFRDSDIMARIGGDEFTVLFANCDQNLAQSLLNRLKENLDHAQGDGPNQPPLSVSIGLAYFDPNSQSSINELLQAADSAMYTQKQSFRQQDRQ